MAKNKNLDKTITIFEDSKDVSMADLMKITMNPLA